MKIVIALISTVFVPAFIIAWLFGGSSILAYLLLGVSTFAISVVLIWAYALVSRIEKTEHCPYRICLRTHILLHLFPFSYLAVFFHDGITATGNILYCIPILLFFWSGRKTWSFMAERYGDLLYKIFYRGNTGMLIASPSLLLVGIVFPDTLLSELYQRLLLVYSAVHFSITGFVVFKMDEKESEAHA